MTGPASPPPPIPEPEAVAFRHRNLPLLLLMAREAVISHFRPVLNRFGLTEQQWRILRVLIEHDEMEQRLVSDACQLLGPSLAGILARMEDTGLIVRRKSPTDQRRVLVSASAHARALAARIAPFIDAEYETLESTLGKAFLDEIYQTLDSLLERHNNKPEGPPPQTPPPGGERGFKP